MEHSSCCSSRAKPAAGLALLFSFVALTSVAGRPTAFMQDDNTREMVLIAGDDETEESKRDIELFNAAASGDVSTVKKLIAAGADVHYGDPVYHGTILHAASRRGQTKVAEELLRAGAEVDHQDTHRRTSLVAAAYNGHLSTVQLLLQNGANVYAADEHDMTAPAAAIRRLLTARREHGGRTNQEIKRFERLVEFFNSEYPDHDGNEL